MTLGRARRELANDLVYRFTDEFASLKPGIGAFFGNRSIVIHKADKSRIACANFAAAPAGSITYPAPGPIVYAPGVPIVPGVPPAPGLPYPTPVPGVPIQGPVVGTPIFNGGMTTSCLTTPAPYSGYSGQPGYPSVSCSAMTTTGSACSSTYNTLCTGNGQTSSCSTSTGSACTTTTTTVTGACVTNTVGPSGASYYSSGSYYPVTTGTATGTNSYSYSYSRTGTGTGTATTKPAQETSGSSTIRTSAADGWLSVGALVAAMFAFF